MIKNAEVEALKEVNVKKEKLGKKIDFGENQQGLMTVKGRIWVPKHGKNRKLVLDEAHKSNYSIHLGSTKTYRDLRRHFWWPGMKPKVVKYISNCLTCAQVKHYGRKCRTPLCWLEAGEKKLPCPELVRLTNEKIEVIQANMKAAQDRQRSYASLKQKPYDIKEGELVMLKVSPWKGVMRFGKKGKLNPRYIGPFKVLKVVATQVFKFGVAQRTRRNT
ncbi:uncharacterized protein LOC111897700 [Lactuca sativa]|uniref:uncharacterized protein LOC111897700 n=1 Tax=Lactuca sativa TaxID=4236 RepID=UPI000CD98938|nr:uncharacterized protein LOC111897700 [Lactuca sativa]